MPIAKTCKQNLTEKRFCTTSTPDCKCYAHKRLVCNACQTCVSSTFNKLQKSQNRKIARTKIYLRWFGIPTQYEQRDFCILPQYCTKTKTTRKYKSVSFFSWPLFIRHRDCRQPLLLPQRLLRRTVDTPYPPCPCRKNACWGNAKYFRLSAVPYL